MAAKPKAKPKGKAKAGAKRPRRRPARVTPPAARPRGRPTGLTPEVADSILSVIADGGSLRDAAASVGVRHTLICQWRANGEKPGARAHFADFADRLKATRAAAKLDMIALITKHARKSWLACAWILERRYPNEFGLRHRVQAQIESGLVRALERMRGSMDDDTFRRLLEQVCGIQSGTPARGAAPSAGGARDASDGP